MRLIILISFLSLLSGCTGTKPDSGLQDKVSGTWIPVSQEIGGNILPKTAFEKQKLILKDSTYTVVAESIDEGVVKYSGNKMDIYGKNGVNAGKHFTALYKYENGKLTICYNLAGDGYPESLTTKGKPAYFLSVFEKE